MYSNVLLLLCFPPCTVLLLLSTAIAGTTGLNVLKFTEVDYLQFEGRTLYVTIDALHVDDSFSIRVRSLTYQQAEQLTGKTLDQLVAVGVLKPANYPSNPAEIDPNGQQDFNATAFEIIINPTLEKEEYELQIGFLDDIIQEDTEGFVMMLEVLGNNSVDFLYGFLRILKIADNDAVDFGFSKSVYTVNEGAGVQDNLIHVNRIGITELDYDVELFVQQTDTSGIVAISENVTIKSSEQSAAVRLEVIDDDIVRGDITVEIGVIPEVGTGLATIEIKENDKIVVGLQSPSVTQETLTIHASIISGQSVSVIIARVRLTSDETKEELDAYIFLCDHMPSCYDEIDLQVHHVKNTVGTTAHGTLKVLNNLAGLEVDPERDTFTVILEPPPAPENLIGVADFESKHINISWSPVHVQHFVHQYELLIAIDSGQENQTEQITNHTHLIYENADLDKTYVLKVRAENVFGNGPYSEPHLIKFLPSKVSSVISSVQTLPKVSPVSSSVQPSTPAGPSLSHVLWLWVTIAALFFLSVCWLCIIMCFILLCNAGKGGRSYYPRKKEKKHRHDLEKYRSTTPTSNMSTDDADVSIDMTFQ